MGSLMSDRNISHGPIYIYLYLSNSTNTWCTVPASYLRWRYCCVFSQPKPLAWPAVGRSGGCVGSEGGGGVWRCGEDGNHDAMSCFRVSTPPVLRLSVPRSTMPRNGTLRGSLAGSICCVGHLDAVGEIGLVSPKSASWPALSPCVAKRPL